MKTTLVHFQVLCLANHILHLSVTQLGHDLTNLLGHQEKVVHYMLWLTCELLPQLFVLGCNTHRASVQVTFAHHDTTHSNEGTRGKSKLLCSKKASNDNITSSLELSIRLQLHTITQSVQNQSLLCLCEAKLPRKASSLHSSPSGSSCSSVVSTDSDMIGKCLGNSGSNDTNTNLRNKLHRHLSSGLGVLQVMDKLSKILNGVNVVMRWRGDKTDSRCCVTILCNVFRYFESRKLSSLTGLGSLSHLDLDLVTVCQVVRSHAKTTRRNLLNTGPTIVEETHRILTAFTGIRTSPNSIHRLCKSLVSLTTD
mmetsp:Transcript_5822/g.12947  ORF Transcript_5822/g.12947 Transcript_5822/m.12947 type:complete len:310 (-) Transcript_5822:859-1788(-)